MTKIYNFAEQPQYQTESTETQYGDGDDAGTALQVVNVRAKLNTEAALMYILRLSADGFDIEADRDAPGWAIKARRLLGTE